MSNEKIIAEAKKRFRKCQIRESAARENWKADYRFGHGDSVNLFQWEQGQVDARTQASKPVFTVNRVKNYCLQIINDARQNKAQIEVRPVGGGASFKSAEIMEGIIRHIEYISNAQQAYDKAMYDCVFGGIGWFRVCTGYVSDESFEQEAYIRRVSDSLSVYLDPGIQEFDGSDATYGFVFSDHDREAWEKAHPRDTDISNSPPLGNDDLDDTTWLRDNKIRVAEYYRKVLVPDVMHYTPAGTTIRESMIDDPEGLDLLRQASVQKRKITTPRIEWYLIAGDRIVDKAIWPGKYIPLIRIVGVETVIEGELDRAGHVRGLIDPQKAYNWYTSSGVEFVAAQSKSPWIAPVSAIEGYEETWRVANLVNTSILPYNSLTDDGQEIAPPHRADPPVYAGAFLDGMKVSINEMEIASGQPAAVLGEPSNERSGKAITERQRAALNSTYHFVDHQASALKFAGRILIDLIPKIYDTERVMKIMAQDGTPQTIQIDPNAQQAHTPVKGLDPESIDPMQVAAIFAPGVGTYDVVAEIGPQFTTMRQEAVNALADILAQNESLTPLVGDLLFKNMDWPGAQDIAARLRNMVPPQALGTVDPHITQLQQQLAQQHMLLQQMQQALEQAKNKAESTAYMKEIDMYKAESERLKAVGGIDPEALRPVIREMVSQLLGLPVNQAIAAHMQEDAQRLLDTGQHPLQDSMLQHQQTMMQQAQQQQHDQTMQQQAPGPAQ